MPGTQPAPAPLVTVGEGSERKGQRPPAQAVQQDIRYATPDWRREPTSETDPRKGR